jgi:phytoene dehydrogenase-like protein
MDYLERAYDEAKYGWYSSRPYLDCAIQSTIDPDMAPPGKHVMSCFVQYAPYELRESDWESERQNLGDTVQATLESFFPGFGDLVLHREVVTPLDIERVVGLSEGNIFAGEFLAPQMFFFRPAPGWNQYRTPIDGYYQCGSGTHPGGCVMGAPGKRALAAGQQILGEAAVGSVAGSMPHQGSLPQRRRLDSFLNNQSFAHSASNPCRLTIGHLLNRPHIDRRVQPVRPHWTNAQLRRPAVL